MRFVSRRRRGVSSIVGSIFFVLIMIVSIASLVTIFNSFASYNGTVNKAGNAQVQADKSQVSITSSTFGSFPPSSPTNFNVAASCSATATSPTNQNKLFFASSMWWDFFVCNSSFQYSTSFDGVTWEAATTIPNLVSGYTAGPYFDIQVVSGAMFLAIAKASSSAFQFGEATLAAGGTYASPAGTITWVTAPAQLTTTANALGPIQIAEDSAGDEWVSVVQGTCTTTSNCAIAVYEHQACATSSAGGWEAIGATCTTTTSPANYSPTALNSLSEDAQMMLFPSISTYSTTGVVLIYGSNSGSNTNPFGTLGVLEQSVVGGTAGSNWFTVTVTGLSQYSLSSSSALITGTALYFAGPAGAGPSTGTLRFWAIPFTSMSMTSATVTEAQIESSGTWQAALTFLGTTLVLFDNPPASTDSCPASDTCVQYYTSSTLGSIWSAAILLDSAETSVNGLSPASGAFAVTWSNSANSVRFAALSTLTVTNSDPYSVHVVDLYVQNPASNLLVAHYYYNSTEDFDYWIGQGITTTIPIHFIWAAGTSYLFTIGTDTGVTAQFTSTSPPVTSTTCSAGKFLTEISPGLTCSGLSAASPIVALASNANSCSDSATTAEMMGLDAAYTTSTTSTGSVYVVFTFNVASPAASNVNSVWQLAYGTGAAPSCGSAASGTLTAQPYTINTESTTSLGTSQSVGVTITGLAAGTAYWFDIEATDSSSGTWVYSLPSMSVTDVVTSTNQTPELGYSSNGASCAITSATTSAAGFAASYIMGASSSGYSGNLYLTLSFQVAQTTGVSGINSQWRVDYGTGTAPACGATTGLGTTVGNQYELSTESAVELEMGQSESFVIPNLSPGTTYWFDVQVTDSTAASWTYSNPVLAVSQVPTAQNLPPNVNFASTANTCSDVTLTTAKMMGLGTTYTTLSSSSGSIFAALTFKVASPATLNLNSKWQVFYGTGTAPACNAAATGTAVGRQYTINTEAAVVGGMGQTIGFVLTGLTPGTQYWFDVQAADSSTGSWMYSNPALSVMDIMPADFVHSNAALAFSTETCTHTAAATDLMMGFAMQYTPTSFGKGNVQVVLTFNVIGPAVKAPPVTSQWLVAYGTGTAPACNAATSGTTVGNPYIDNTANNGPAADELAQSVGFTVVGLTPGSTYWFDVQAADSSIDQWIYSNPQIAVVELP